MQYNYSELRKEAIKNLLANVEGDLPKDLSKHLRKGIDEFVNVLINHIDEGDDVRIKNLGSFYRTEVRRTKKFVSALTGESYDLDNSYRIGFRPSTSFHK